MDRKLTISITPQRIMGGLFFIYTLGNFCVPMLKWNALFIQVPLYMFFGVCMIHVKRGNVSIRKFLLWYAPFTVICMISCLYAPTLNESIKLFPSLIMALLFGFSLTVFLSFEGTFKYIKYSYILVSIVVGIQLIQTFQQKSWWSRLGEGFGMNENLVALYFLISFCFSLNEMGEHKALLLNIFSMIISSYVILLTGSKKALFAAVIFAFLLYILRAGKLTKKMQVIIITTIAVIVMYHFIMNVELLYNILGFRIQAMINTLVLRDFSSSGNSTGERGDMIVFGFLTFIRSPLWGRGLNAFQELYGRATGHYAYAHNNYIELLVDLGLIGFCTYYSILWKSFRMIKRLKNQLKENALWISLLVVVLFYDIAMVSYYDTRIIMLIIVVTTGLDHSLRNGGKKLHGWQD